MSLRWSSYVAPKFPKGGSKMQNGCFSSKIAFLLRKSATKFNPVKGAFIGLTIHAKIIGGERSRLPEILCQTDRVWREIADFRSIFAGSASAVTASDKSSIITNRKSTTRFLMNPRWTPYVVPKPPKGESKTQSVQNLNNKLRYLRNGTI